MAATLASFYVTFPEFQMPAGQGDTAQDALVTAKLAEATSRVDYACFYRQTNADLAVLYLAAHLMAVSPFGLAMRLANATKDYPSVYYAEYERLARNASYGYRVP